MQKIRVQPFRCYRLSFWARTEDLEPSHLFQVDVRGQGVSQLLMTFTPRLKRTEEWREVSVGFNSMEEEEALVPPPVEQVGRSQQESILPSDAFAQRPVEQQHDREEDSEGDAVE